MTMVKNGLHIVAELYGCSRDALSRVEDVKRILNAAVQESGMMKVNEAYHQFSPHGATGFILLTTSHLSVHTWPEDGYAAVDIFTCGDPAQGRKAVEVCERLFQAQTTEKKELARGARDTESSLSDSSSSPAPALKSH